MKSYSSGVGAKLISDLRSSVRDSFHLRARTVLEALYPPLRATFSMKSVDRAGIDDCVFIDESGRMSDAYQFKGFEALELNSSHVQQCKDSIESLQNSPFSVKRYFLVVNRIVRGKIRMDLEDALKRVVDSGKAEMARLLDLEGFLEAVFTEARSQITELLNQSASQFQKLHAERMEEDFYFDEVPFHLDATTDFHLNPLLMTAQQIESLSKDLTNKRSWSFIIGEFGFGKTSLALRLADTLNRKGLKCLYLPIAQFPEGAFNSEFELMWALLKFLQDGQADRDQLRDQILHVEFKELLKTDKRCVVIVDGIDEHPICWRANGLRNLFDVFKAFNAFCVFTMREEFYSERAGSFDAALHKAPRRRLFVKMRAWPDSLILTFTREWRKRVRSKPSLKNLDVFEEAIESGAYNRLFGDIPKRPLFLKMLLEKVADDGVHEIQLAALYLDIFIKKFWRDLDTSAPRPLVSRPLNLTEDRHFVGAQLLTVMTCAAELMLRETNGQLEMFATLLSSVLMNELKRRNLGLDLSSILMHSVLIPAGRRAAASKGGDLHVTFAHRSYQEFFTARYLLKAMDGRILEERSVRPLLSGAVGKFFDEMRNKVDEYQ